MHHDCYLAYLSQLHCARSCTETKWHKQPPCKQETYFNCTWNKFKHRTETATGQFYPLQGKWSPLICLTIRNTFNMVEQLTPLPL